MLRAQDKEKGIIKVTPVKTLRRIVRMIKLQRRYDARLLTGVPPIPFTEEKLPYLFREENTIILLGKFGFR